MRFQQIELSYRRFLARGLTALFLLVCFGLSLIVAVTIATLNDTEAISPYLPMPNRVGFLYHAAAGMALDSLGASPRSVAIQWVKAASHARSTSMVRDAATGLERARQREAATEYFDTTICAMVRHGSPFSIDAVRMSGVHCSASVDYGTHVAEGSLITYDSRPPIGGPHYDRPYPSYGIVEHSVLPGYWVHNLEHGAIVLLYRCPTRCPDLVTQIRSLYAQLKREQNGLGGEARLLALPYLDMDHRLAVVAWDHLLELDQFNQEAILRFYARHINRGPECVNLTCPE